MRAVVAAAPGAAEPELLACSSAGGGLRLAVVGTERLTVEEAAHRVARSAGSRVVHVHAGPLDAADVRMLRGSRPGAVLLTGGADGDDPRPCCTTPPGSPGPVSGSRSCWPATRAASRRRGRAARGHRAHRRDLRQRRATPR